MWVAWVGVVGRQELVKTSAPRVTPAIAVPARGARGAGRSCEVIRTAAARCAIRWSSVRTRQLPWLGSSWNRA